MVDWQVTAKGIYCEAVEDDVVIIVFADHSVRCTGYSKYGPEAKPEALAILKKKSRVLKRKLSCEGPQDYRVIDYKDSVFGQDK